MFLFLLSSIISSIIIINIIIVIPTSTSLGKRGIVGLNWYPVMTNLLPSTTSVVRGMGDGEMGKLGTETRRRGQTDAMDVPHFHGIDVLQ